MPWSVPPKELYQGCELEPKIVESPLCWRRASTLCKALEKTHLQCFVHQHAFQLVDFSAERGQRYDHRLQSLVHRTGNVTVTTDLGVPRSTARGGWARRRRSWSVWMVRTSLSRSSDRRP
jgi:hypothetical protein